LSPIPLLRPIPESSQPLGNGIDYEGDPEPDCRDNYCINWQQPPACPTVRSHRTITEGKGHEGKAEKGNSDESSKHGSDQTPN